MNKLDQEQKGFVFTGWHMLAIMVLFFGTIISVNLTMAWNAVSSWSGLVVPNTYIASQEFNGKVAAGRALAASGIEGDIAIEGGRIAYRLVDAQGAPVIADNVIAHFKRPVDERADFTVVLTPEAAGLFTAERVITDGQWIIDIGAKREDAAVFHQTLRVVLKGGKV